MLTQISWSRRIIQRGHKKCITPIAKAHPLSSHHHGKRRAHGQKNLFTQKVPLSKAKRDLLLCDSPSQSQAQEGRWRGTSRYLICRTQETHLQHKEQRMPRKTNSPTPRQTPRRARASLSGIPAKPKTTGVAEHADTATPTRLPAPQAGTGMRREEPGMLQPKKSHCTLSSFPRPPVSTLGRLRAPAAPKPDVMLSGDSAGRGTVPTQYLSTTHSITHESGPEIAHY